MELKYFLRVLKSMTNGEFKAGTRTLSKTKQMQKRH